MAKTQKVAELKTETITNQFDPNQKVSLFASQYNEFHTLFKTYDQLPDWDKHSKTNHYDLNGKIIMRKDEPFTNGGFVFNYEEWLRHPEQIEKFKNHPIAKTSQTFTNVELYMKKTEILQLEYEAKNPQKTKDEKGLLWAEVKDMKETKHVMYAKKFGIFPLRENVSEMIRQEEVEISQQNLLTDTKAGVSRKE